MKHQYLNKTGNRSLLLFFAGWGMDANPFMQLKTDYADVLIAYDYSDCNFNNLEIPQTYRNTFLFAWSFGVFAAERWMEESQFKPTFSIAINGTLHPVDDTLGIPENIFNATLQQLSEQSLLKFYRRICSSSEQYDELLSHRPMRTIQSLRSELEAIRDEYLRKKTTPAHSQWSKAYVADYDRIFPPKAQIRQWENATTIVHIPDSHLPKRLVDIVLSNLIDKQLIKTKFEKCQLNYDNHAKCQHQAAQRLLDKWKEIDKSTGMSVYEIGCGSGIFTKLYAPIFHPKTICLNDIIEIRKNFFSGIDCPLSYFCADAEYEYPRNVFERIVSSSAIQWFENTSAWLNNIRDTLADEGLIVLSTFGKDNLAEMRLVTPFSLNYLSVQDWQNALANSGFLPLILEEEKIQHQFDSPIDLINSLRHTGVNGIITGSPESPKQLISKIQENIPRDENGRFQLTYNPIYIIAKKLRQK